MRNLEGGRVCGPNRTLHRKNLPSLRYVSFSVELERYLHSQPRDAWTFELGLRRYMERW